MSTTIPTPTSTSSSSLQPVYDEVERRRDRAWLDQSRDAGHAVSLTEPRDLQERLARDGGLAVAAVDAHRIITTYPGLPDGLDVPPLPSGYPVTAEVYEGMTPDDRVRWTTREHWWFHQGRAESYAKALTWLEEQRPLERLS